MTDDNPPKDTFSLHPTYGAASINAGIFSGEYSALYEDAAEEFGITVHLDGPSIALSAGTTYHADNDEELYTYHSLSIGQARDLASELTKAADRAERRQNELPRDEPDEEKGIIRKLLG